ncbi:MAG: antitoxin family protein [Nitrospirae bacterium]|nr:antitoxin family protein [Nitrospirota bacterium]
MSKVIEAVYENGVFRPTTKIRMKDNQKVQLQVLADDDWKERFDRVVRAVRNKTARFSPEEIDADINEAITDVRNARRARSGCP